MLDERWIRVATGAEVEDANFTLERVLTHRQDLSEPSPFRYWGVSLELVDDDVDDEAGRHHLASATGVQFALPNDGDWSELREMADAADGDLHAVVETLIARALDDELQNLVTMEALYVSSVHVTEAVRGQRWGCAAIANLLDGMDRTESVVLALEPVGRPEHPVVARIAMEFGAAKVEGSAMRWHHTSLADLDEAVRKWLTGPIRLD